MTRTVICLLVENGRAQRTKGGRSSAGSDGYKGQDKRAASRLGCSLHGNQFQQDAPPLLQLAGHSHTWSPHVSRRQAQHQALKAWAVAGRENASRAKQESLEASARHLWGAKFDVVAAELLIRLGEATDHLHALHFPGLLHVGRISICDLRPAPAAP